MDNLFGGPPAAAPPDPGSLRRERNDPAEGKISWLLRGLAVAFSYHPYRLAGRVETVLRGGLCLLQDSGEFGVIAKPPGW